MYPVLISLLIDTQNCISKRSLLYQIGIYLYVYLELSNMTNWWIVYHSDLTAFFFVELGIIQNCLVPAPITLSRIYGSQDHVVSSQALR